MNTIFSLDFWFRLIPMSMTPVFMRSFFILFSAFVIFGAMANIVAKRKHDDALLVKVYKKIAQLFYGMGWFGLVILFFSYQEIYFFGARFWFLVWGVVLLYWLATIVKFIRIDIPVKRQELASKKEINKYLPRRSR
jgi:hypothetical protein